MSMAGCVSVHPQSHPGPTGGNLNPPPGLPPVPQPNFGAGPAAPNPGQQGGPGLSQASSQDPYPGAMPYHYIPRQHRPYFYVHPTPMPPPPPPPPCLQCQWPMPFPYNPFSGLPGMGYGMVLPQFPPAPFMEPQSYMFPQPQLQPVDYRRLIHPQYPVANPFYQNQNQHRRFHSRPQQTSSAPRETVNSEVQTEPLTGLPGYARESPLVGSDSGRGTNSSVPSSPCSSAERRGRPEEESDDALPSNGPKTNVLVSGRGQGKSTSKHSLGTSPSRPNAVQSHSRTPLKLQKRRKGSFGWENSAACKRGSQGYSDTWSVCSTDGMVPVCSSPAQADEMITKDRRVSFPDILMSGGGVSSPVVNEEYNNNNADNVSIKHGDDSSSMECEYKIVKLPYNHKLLSGSRGVNESVWSVDSIAPHVPTREWMMRNGLLEPLSESQRVPENELEDEDEGIPPGNELEDEDEGIPPGDVVPKDDGVPDDELDEHGSLPHGETTLDATPHHISLDYVKSKRKMNESIWSLDSIAPYVPSKEVLNGVLESDVIIEKPEGAPDSSMLTENGSPAVLQEDRVSDNDEDESLLCEDATFSVVPQHTSSDYVKRKMNESTWSVESLAPYICSKEWLIKNGILEPDTITEEVAEGGQDGGLSTQNGNLAVSQDDRVPDNEFDETETFLHEETIHVPPQQMSFHYVQMKRKMNESVWSVESLAPYIPSKELLMQYNISKSDFITEEVNADAQDGGVLSTQNDCLTVKAAKERRMSRRFSLSTIESVPTYTASASWLANHGNFFCHGNLPADSQQNVNVVFSTPAGELGPEKRPEILPANSEQTVTVTFSTPPDKLSPSKRPEMESEIVPSKQKEAKPRRGLDMETEEKQMDPLASPTLYSQSKTSASVPGDEEGEMGGVENGSSEPKADESPNQESLSLTEHLERSPCSPKMVLCNPGQPIPCNRKVELEPEKGIREPQVEPEVASRPTSERLVVQTAERQTATVSPSKGHFVDCGIQCSDLQDANCCCRSSAKEKGSKLPPDILTSQGQQGGGQQKRQNDYWRPNKAKGGENGHGQRNTKKYWKNGPPNPQQSGQTNQPNKPFTQRSGPRNGQDEAFNGYRPAKQTGGNGRNPRC